MFKRLLFILVPAAFIIFACAPIQTPEPVASETSMPTATVAPSETQTRVAPTETATQLPPAETAILPRPTEQPSPEPLLTNYRLIFREGDDNIAPNFETKLFEDNQYIETPQWLKDLNLSGVYALSPDKSKLAFLESIEPSMGQTAHPNIYVVDLQTQQIALLSLPAELFINPISTGFSWSPDNKSIVFSVETNHHSKIAIWRLEKDSLEFVLQDSLTTSNYDLYPQWSPNGEWISFVRYTSSNGYPNRAQEYGTLFIIHPDGSQIQNIDSTVYLYLEGNFPVWSLDSSWLAYTAGQTSPKLRLYNITNGETRWLTNNSKSELFPDWSPTNLEITFVSADDNKSIANFAFDVYTSSLDGTIAQLTHDSLANVPSRWSPDGDLIFFLSSQNIEHGGPQLYVMSRDGIRQQRLSEGFVFELPIVILK
jgi:Tol biopolymer transport system component